MVILIFCLTRLDECFFIPAFLSSQQKTPALQDYLLIQQNVRVKKFIFKMPTKDVRTHDTQMLDHIWLVLSTLKR